MLAQDARAIAIPEQTGKNMKSMKIMIVMKSMKSTKVMKSMKSIQSMKRPASSSTYQARNTAVDIDGTMVTVTTNMRRRYKKACMHLNTHILYCRRVAACAKAIANAPDAIREEDEINQRKGYGLSKQATSAYRIAAYSLKGWEHPTFQVVSNVQRFKSHSRFELIVLPAGIPQIFRIQVTRSIGGHA